MQDLIQQMRRDWDTRAREDARYYVAFGRRNQDDEEFAQTAEHVLDRLRRDCLYLPDASVRERRFLEIGCGLGRLMRPLAADCGEIHGVDISPEMVARAADYLASTPSTHVSVTEGNDLSAFAGDSFDFVYSYAVFQHIPDRSLVERYIEEAYRVLKPGGIFSAQFNGARPDTACRDSWVGVWIAEEDLFACLKERGWRVLASEGRDTQYLWVTARKLPPGAGAPPGRLRIASVRNEAGGRALFAGGPHGFGTMIIEGLSDEHADLASLEFSIGDRPAQITRIWPVEANGARRLTIYIPDPVRTGLQPAVLSYLGRRISNLMMAEVRPSPPAAPRIVHVGDGKEYCLGPVIKWPVMQVAVADLIDAGSVGVAIGAQEVSGLSVYRADPVKRLYLINVPVPPGIAGKCEVRVSADGHELPPVAVEVVRRD